MAITSLVAQKLSQSQTFLENGNRVPVSILWVGTNHIIQIKSTEKEGYSALQLGFGIRKKVKKSLMGHLKKANVDTSVRFLREVRIDGAHDIKAGDKLLASDVFAPGDLIAVTGTSKGKGFAGGVKRHHFKGGPRTHGQSDRERAPGSIGQTTTPGRVYKGKRMAGKMGFVTSTIRNLVVLDVQGDNLIVKGLVPGVKGSIVMVKKLGSDKKFVPLFAKAKQAEAAESDAKVMADKEGEKENAGK